MKKPAVLALIPARGNSKGILRKNLQPLGGKPLVAYSILTAKESRRIDRIIVSTEDEEIAEVAKSYGAEIPFTRPAELAADDTPDLPVFEHALKWFKAHEAWLPDMVVHLRPTSPLRRVQDVDHGIQLLIKTKADSVRSVCQAREHPRKMWQLDGDRLRPLLKPRREGDAPWNAPRQTLEQVYWQNASVDVLWSKTILEKHSMTGSDIRGFIMEERFSIDIDEPLDLALAELVLQRSEHQEGHAERRQSEIGSNR